MKAAIGKLLAEALALHQSGRVDDAEPLYSAVLERDPVNADAWHLLSRVSLQRGDWKAAAARVLQAIRQQPSVPAFHTSLGEILAAQGRTWEASLCYQEALRLAPGYTPALVNLGNALQQRGRYRDACVAYWRAIQAQPDSPEAFSNLGNALGAEGRHDEALACYLEAHRLQPGSPEVAVNLAAAHLHLGHHAEAEDWARCALRSSPHLVEALSNLSVALLNQQRYEEAEHSAREALRRAPSAAHLHSNLGSVLLQRKEFAAAESACRRALALRPEYPEAASNLGVALQSQDRLEEAAGEFEAVLRARPAFAEAWTNLGTVRQAQGRNAHALACFEEALRLNPAHVKSHFCRSLALLAAGRLREGFTEYEWRWKVLPDKPRAWSQPWWDGSPLEGKTILLYAEQGLGDTIQFARYAPLVAASGGRVVVECQEPVADIVGSIHGVSQVVTPASPLPPFDVQAALMSLPRLLGTTLDTIPRSTPYVAISPALVDRWRDALAPGRGLRVGLAWAGNRQHPGNRQRSFPLDVLAPLGAIPGIQYYSLHVGDEAASEIWNSGGWVRRVLTEDGLPPAGGLPELGALMCRLDLVITADSMPAHLAGALGRPVWTLLSAAADWRWQLGDLEDTPWYPGMRLFRQPRLGDWTAVVERVCHEIRGFAAKTSAPPADEPD
jgi:tetratricopeptide (TPR) repeat protein